MIDNMIELGSNLGKDDSRSDKKMKKSIKKQIELISQTSSDFSIISMPQKSTHNLSVIDDSGADDMYM